ncbi:MAG: SUMF1/EgtB/PvdO family nonheme iron enzyme [Cyanobacteria bacterium J06607_6]
MTSSSLPSVTSANLTLAELRQILRTDMVACRQSTLSLTKQLTTAEFRQQSHPDFSPVGWHLGHIAFTESLWLLEHLKEDACAEPQYQMLFAADGLPKAERENLPALADILTYLQTVRDRTLAYLETAPLYDQLRLWRWILQHESQHAETATYVLAMHRCPSSAGETTAAAPLRPTSLNPAVDSTNMVLVPAGETVIGSDTLDAMDNERTAHAVTTAAYWIDRTPVTVAAYRQFILAGGYQNSQWWQPDGWQWVQQNQLHQPRYWRDEPGLETTPVCGVSWYEADAYACFVGKRLPTEAEWERAARWHPSQEAGSSMPWGEAAIAAHHGNFGGRWGGVSPVGQFPAGRSQSGCDDLLGNVWEWTDSWFEPYAGFTAYPYRGYSKAYFDRTHRVLRGGSWATRPWVLRPAFRNWYQPEVRQLFAGFRCVLGT